VSDGRLPKRRRVSDSSVGLQCCSPYVRLVLSAQMVSQRWWRWTRLFPGDRDKCRDWLLSVRQTSASARDLAARLRRSPYLRSYATLYPFLSTKVNFWWPIPRVHLPLGALASLQIHARARSPVSRWPAPGRRLLTFTKAEPFRPWSK